jgi:hypothetical protein
MRRGVIGEREIPKPVQKRTLCTIVKLFEEFARVDVCGSRALAVEGKDSAGVLFVRNAFSIQYLDVEVKPEGQA